MRTKRWGLGVALATLAVTLGAPATAHAEKNQGPDVSLEFRHEPAFRLRPDAIERNWREYQWSREQAWIQLSLADPPGTGLLDARDEADWKAAAVLAQLDPREPEMLGSPQFGGAMLSAITSLFTDGMLLQVSEARIIGKHRHRLRAYLGRGGAKLVWRVEF